MILDRLKYTKTTTIRLTNTNTKVISDIPNNPIAKAKNCQKTLDKIPQNLNYCEDMSINIVLVGNDVMSTQQAHLEALQSTLQAKNVNVSFEANELTAKLKGNAFVISKDGQVLATANNIATKFNWIEVFSTFADNYANTSADDDGFWRWGQIIPATGEYLCKDCGYVGEFNAGEIFPVCEVCQAGEPDGPCPIDEGYWEAI